jgi:hypothetical protein
MSDVRSSLQAGEHYEASDWRRVTSAPLRRTDSGGLSPGWVVAGVAALAFGAWLWYHIGSGLERSINVERM